MKKKLKQSIKYAPLWPLFKWYSRLIDFLFEHKNLLKRDLLSNAEDRLKTGLFEKIEVLDGPFTGLRYPNFVSFGSAIYAKLAGSYEKDISYFFLQERFKSYNTLIDIGCAEGYYAVGACLINPNLSVYAIDVDKRALEFSREMAILNGVDNRIRLNHHFDWEVADKLLSNGEGIVICDCEGCELNLFDDQFSNVWRKFDYIIELHDFINPGTKEKLVSIFKGSHDINVIREKPKKNTSIVKHLSSMEKEIVLSENRPVIMEWIILEKRR